MCMYVHTKRTVKRHYHHAIKYAPKNYSRFIGVQCATDLFYPWWLPRPRGVVARAAPGRPRGVARGPRRALPVRRDGRAPSRRGHGATGRRERVADLRIAVPGRCEVSLRLGTSRPACLSGRTIRVLLIGASRHTDPHNCFQAAHRLRHHPLLWKHATKGWA